MLWHCPPVESPLPNPLPPQKSPPQSPGLSESRAVKPQSSNSPPGISPGSGGSALHLLWTLVLWGLSKAPWRFGGGSGEGRVWGEEGLSRGVMMPPSGAAVSSRGSDLHCLENSWNPGRSPGPFRRLPTLHDGDNHVGLTDQLLLRCAALETELLRVHPPPISQLCHTLT